MDDLEQTDLIEAFDFHAPCADQCSNRTAFERAEPVHALKFAKLRDLGLRDHPAVADDDQSVDAETFLQAIDLRQQGPRVANIAFMD